MKDQQDYYRKRRSIKDYRNFLINFKTQPCIYTEPHYIENCQFYHYDSKQLENTQIHENITYDRRRTPYGKLNQFLYQGKVCQNFERNCGDYQKCKYCHNVWEYNYHPDIFKTSHCENLYECNYQFCYKLHYSDYNINQKTQITTFAFSEFFRFNLDTFKTLPCEKQYPHQKSFCLFYHSPKDYRRPTFQQYQHTQCLSIDKEGCFNIDCTYSHNKIEQLYHPRRYKSKFCQKHYLSRKSSSTPNDQSSFKSLCPFNKLCSFAHNDEQITIFLIDRVPRNLQFYLYMYKTVWCPITTDHNRSQCVYAHNIQDFRRNPKQKHYQPVQCPYWKKNQNIKSIDDAGCPAGLDCNKCHGWKERQYHPIIYCKIKSGLSDGYLSSLQAKSKTDSDTKRDPYHTELNHIIVSKKLEASSKNTNIQKIVQNQLNKGQTIQSKQQIYLPGTPFFKNNGSSSAQKKSQSERGDTVTKQQTDDKMSQMEQKGSFITTKSVAMKMESSYFNFNTNSENVNDDQLFKVFLSGVNNAPKIQKKSQEGLSFEKKQHQSNNKMAPQKISRTVSKSLGCRRQKCHNFYSKDVTQLLGSKVIEILQQKNVGEIKLINMSEGEVRKINQLSNSQKNLILHKVIYARDAVKKTPTYEQSLVKFFIRHKKDRILSKMKVKKVKQEKLLLLDSQIEALSFLTESEKNQLSQMLKKLTDNRDFESLSSDITKTVKGVNISEFK